MVVGLIPSIEAPELSDFPESMPETGHCEREHESWRFPHSNLERRGNFEFDFTAIVAEHHLN